MNQKTRVDLTEANKENEAEKQGAPIGTVLAQTLPLRHKMECSRQIHSSFPSFSSVENQSRTLR